jgi:hypothetical protein
MIKRSLFDWFNVWTRFGRELSINYHEQVRLQITNEMGLDLSQEDKLKKRRQIWQEEWMKLDNDKKAAELVREEIVEKFSNYNSSGHANIWEQNHKRFIQSTDALL